MKKYLNNNARKPMNTKLSFLLIPLTLACFALCQTAQAVGPDAEGAIAGANNGEGIGVLINRTAGVWNTGTGFEALSQLTSGNQNTATGLRALSSDTNGGFNTATGVYSLFSNTSGFFNSATGGYSLANNTDGNYNTANGYGALYFNTEGEQNTATGFAALYRNTTGVNNTANGYQALNRNTTGEVNTANGAFALFSNTTGSGNTANGIEALRNNNGNFNTATGNGALFSNTVGAANTVVGFNALFANTTGQFNTGAGAGALANDTTGSGNIALGYNAGTFVSTADNVTCIGADGQNVSDSCYIGRIFGQTSSGGTAVFINSDGKLGTTTSSRRFKKEIKPMDQTSEGILGLKPVTFHYKSDASATPQFGLIAEEVAEVNPDLVARDKNGEIYTVRYEQINAMLLNEFLKEHKKVEAQQATITELKSTVAQQQKGMEAVTARLDEQAAQIQRVSAQVEMTKPAPTLVLNNP